MDLCIGIQVIVTALSPNIILKIFKIISLIQTFQIFVYKK